MKMFKKTILLALTGLLGLVSCSVYDMRMGEVDGMYSMDKMAGAGPAGMPNGGQGGRAERPASSRPANGTTWTTGTSGAG